MESPDLIGPDIGDRRSLPRVSIEGRVSAAVESVTRKEALGLAEVADFSGLGLALRGLANNPVAEAGDSLWVTLIAPEGIIPLRAKIVHVSSDGTLGLRLLVVPPPQQHFLIRLYENNKARTGHGSVRTN